MKITTIHPATVTRRVEINRGDILALARSGAPDMPDDKSGEVRVVARRLEGDVGIGPETTIVVEWAADNDGSHE